MKLTKLERLQLITQLTILDKLNKNDHNSDNIKILEEGFEYHYDQIINHLSDDVSPEISSFVYKLLQMYRCLENYYSSNPSDIKAINDAYAHYNGFDYNDDAELDHARFANYLLDHEEKFYSESAKFQRNSHSRMLEHYKIMLEKFEKIGRNELAQTDVYQILNLVKSPVNVNVNVN